MAGSIRGLSEYIEPMALDIDRSYKPHVEAGWALICLTPCGEGGAKRRMGVVQERVKTLFIEPIRFYRFDPHPTLRYREGPPSPQGGGKSVRNLPEVVFKRLPCDYGPLAPRHEAGGEIKYEGYWYCAPAQPRTIAAYRDAAAWQRALPFHQPRRSRPSASPPHDGRAGPRRADHA